MYSFAQRSDTRVFDEPLYGYFLQRTGVDRPDRKASMQLMELDGNRVISKVLLGDFPEEVLFYKHISNHLVGLELDFLDQMQGHILFIRDPAEIIASYAKVISHPTIDDVAMEHSTRLYDTLQSKGLEPVVLDSADFLKDPARMMQTLCEKLGIPYQASMLNWEAGARPEDGPWATFWYDNVHRSTGFSPYQPKEIQLTGHLAELEARCRPHYDYLRTFRLR